MFQWAHLFQCELAKQGFPFILNLFCVYKRENGGTNLPNGMKTGNKKKDMAGF